MRSRLALGIPLLALALLAWWLARGVVDAGAPGPVPIAADAIDGAGLESEAGLGAMRDSGGAARSDPRETRFVPLPAPANEFLARFVDDATHSVVANSEVFALALGDDASWDPIQTGDGLSSDLERELAAHGTRFETDARGELRLPEPFGPLVLGARKDGSFGAAFLGSDPAPEVIVHLVRSADCSVHVSDANGRPAAGSCVVLRARHGAVWRSLTSPSGEARIANLGWLLSLEPNHGSAWNVELEEAALERAVRWFTPEDPLPERIDLAAASAHSLRLQVVAANSVPVPVEGYVEADPLWISSSHARLRLAHGESFQVPLVAGSARIQRAAPGVELTLEASFAGGWYQAEHLRAPAAGESAGEVEMRLDEDAQVLLAAVSDASGAALSAGEWQWLSYGFDATSGLQFDAEAENVHCREGGRLALVVERRPKKHEGYAGPGEPHWFGVLRGEREGRWLTSDPIALFPGLEAPIRDLGRIRMHAEPPLAEGHVHDENGKPLARVRVGVEQRYTWEESEEYGRLAGLDDSLQTLTDADGFFRIRGHSPARPIVLHFSRAGYRPESGQHASHTESGSSGLEFTLVRCGSIQTSLRLPFPFGRPLQWRATRDGGEESEGFDQGALETGGRVEFELRDLSPGSYRVQLVRDEEQVQTLLDVAGVRVLPGQRTLDARLLEVDLAGLLGDPEQIRLPEPSAPGPGRRILRIFDAAGRPIESGIWCQDFGNGVVQDRWHRGIIVLEPETAGGSFSLWAPGFQVWSGRTPDQSVDLRLQPSWFAQVEVEIPPELRRPDVVLWISPSIAMADWNHGQLAGSLLPIELDGQGKGSFECPGECDLELRLQAVEVENTGGLRRERAWPVGLGRLEFHGTPGIESVRIPIDPEELKELLERLRVPR